jgi:hypothetical protein
MPKSIIKEDSKIEKFANEYVENGMNGTQAYKALSPLVTDATAGTQSTRLLKKDKTKKAIAERLLKDSSISKVINQAITEIPKAPMDWSTKHKYIVTALKLKGYLKDEGSKSVNVGLFVSHD